MTLTRQSRLQEVRRALPVISANQRHQCNEWYEFLRFDQATLMQDSPHAYVPICSKVEIPYFLRAEGPT